MIQVLQKIWFWLVSLLHGLIEWIDETINSVLIKLYEMLPADAVDIITAWITVSELAGIIQDITWFIPLWRILGMYIAAFYAAALIRAVRWIMAVAPTIGG